MMEYSIWIKTAMHDPEVYCYETEKENAIETAYLKWINNKDEKVTSYARHKRVNKVEAVWVEESYAVDLVVWDSDDIVIQAKAEAEEILSNLKVTIDGNNIIVDDGFSIESHESYEPDVLDVAEKLEIYVYNQAKVLRTDDVSEMLEKKAEEAFKV